MFDYGTIVVQALP